LQINPQVPDGEMAEVARRYGEVVQLQRTSPGTASITYSRPASAVAAAKKLDGAAFGKSRVAASLGENPPSIPPVSKAASGDSVDRDAFIDDSWCPFKPGFIAT
jgi:hypothetical protein